MEASSRQRENLELARRGIAAYNAGDREAMFELFSPDIVVYTPPGLANAGTYRGFDEFRVWMQEWEEAWERFEVETDAIEPVGERHVVASVVQSGVGRGSGMEVKMPAGYVFEGEEGRCVYFAIHPSPEAARSDALERERSGPSAQP
jgi:ketosteroid isomerase-like protein